MYFLSPSRVSFGTLVFGNVSSVAIDRLAAKEAVEYSDAGPYPVFADVPEQKVMITLVQQLSASDFAAPLPGALGTTTITARQNNSDAGAITLQASTVVRSVMHSMTGKAAMRTIVLIAISSNGSANPISIL